MPRDFSNRSKEREIMDGDIASFEVFDVSLKQIETVNRLTLGYKPVLSWLKKQMSAPQNGPISILDIGFGRGSLLRAASRLAARRNLPVALTGIDIAPWSVAAASLATPGHMHIDYRGGDVFSAGEYADFIVCSHVTHHMTDQEIIALLRWLEEHARRGWLIADLHRHVVPYIAAKLILLLAPVNSMVRNDGAVSVARAFTKDDWKGLLAAADVAADIRWHFPFRYSIARKKQV